MAAAAAAALAREGREDAFRRLFRFYRRRDLRGGPDLRAVIDFSAPGDQVTAGSWGGSRGPLPGTGRRSRPQVPRPSPPSSSDRLAPQASYAGTKCPGRNRSVNSALGYSLRCPPPAVRKSSVWFPSNHEMGSKP